jgi:hypothetical protein
MIQVIDLLNKRTFQQDKGAIAGHVTTKQSEPIVGAVVMITEGSPEHNDIAALTNGKGEFRLNNLTPGDYSVLVNTENLGVKTLRTRVSASQVSLLNFVLGEQ